MEQQQSLLLLPRIHFEIDGRETTKRKYVLGIDNVNKELEFMGGAGKLILIEPNKPIPSRSFLGKQINSKKTPLFPNNEFKEEILNCFAMSQSEILQQQQQQQQQIRNKNDCHRRQQQQTHYVTPMVTAGPPMIRKMNRDCVNGLSHSINTAPTTTPEGTGFDEIMTIIKQTNDVHMFFVGLKDGICRHLILPPINKRTNKDIFWRFHFFNNNATTTTSTTRTTPHYVLLDEEGIYLHYRIGGGSNNEQQNKNKKQRRRGWFFSNKERRLLLKETTDLKEKAAASASTTSHQEQQLSSRREQMNETIDLMLFIISSRCKQTIQKQSNKRTNYVY